MKKLLSISSVVFTFCLAQLSSAQIMSTVAGHYPFAGYAGDGGPATSAELFNPGNLMVDNSGNIYFCDESNYVVRMVNTSGIINTIAGNYAYSKPTSGGYSGDGGPATAAEFSTPIDVKLDTTGNMYVADFGNNVIRMVNTSGIISTIAGNFAYGIGNSGDGGPATAAELSQPNGLAFDATGNLYIATNSFIRMVNSSGIISTFAGNGVNSYSGDGGPATAAGITSNSVAIDQAGNVYFSDEVDMVVRKINTSGIISTLAGNGYTAGGFYGDGGPATNAELDHPVGITFDSFGDVFFAENFNSVIREVNTSGIISTVVGELGLAQGYAQDGAFEFNSEMGYAYGAAFDSHGNFYYTDPDNVNIREAINTQTIVSGYTYTDANHDCLYEGTETPVANVSMKLITATDTLTEVSSPTGFYYFLVPPGTNYTIVFDSVSNSGYVINCPSSGRMHAMCPSADNNFAVTCNPNIGFDLTGSLSVCIDTPVANLNTATIMACIYNNLCPPVNGTLNIIIDTNILVTGWTALNAPTISGDTLKWNFSNISSAKAQNQCVSVTGTVKDSFAILHGDSNYVTMLVTPVAGDTVPSNNSITYWVKAYPFNCVGLPYDPNNKSVYPAGEISPSQRLTYTIEFENTGNYTAANVTVYDTLSPFLDVSTLDIISSSYHVTTQVLPGNILKFTFTGINLLPSISNLAKSRGNVVYSIKPFITTPGGTKIYNKAGVYFNSQPEIQTNTTTNIIDTTNIITAVKALANQPHFVCFPNPFNNFTQIIFNSGGTHYLEVDDLTGRKLKWIEFSGSQYTLSMQGLSQGIYFLRAFDNDQHYISTQKLVVEK